MFILTSATYSEDGIYLNPVNKPLKREQTNSGVSVVSFPLAVRRSHSGHKTDFISIVAWKHLAEYSAEHFPKGTELVVRGSLQIRKYQDRNGNTRTVAEVVAEEIEPCGKG